MNKIKKIALATLCVVFLGFQVMPAVADMLILPMRVYFKDGDRMQALTVLNNGKVQAIYRLRFEHKKQQPDGSYLNLTEPLNPNYDPSKWLVYSPRQVDLAPQGKQAIKLSLRRPADMPDGEFRIHTVLERIARENIENRGEDAIRGRMMINVGFAVPVIIRKGKYDTTASLQEMKMLPPDPKAADTRSRAEIKVLRKGKYSSVGRIEAYWTPAGGGEEIRVNGQTSLIIYPEVDLRTDTVTFDRMIQGGSMRLVYRGMEADRDIVFDEKVFSVQ